VKVVENMKDMKLVSGLRAVILYRDSPNKNRRMKVTFNDMFLGMDKRSGTRTSGTRTKETQRQHGLYVNVYVHQSEKFEALRAADIGWADVNVE